MPLSKNKLQGYQILNPYANMNLLICNKKGGAGTLVFQPINKINNKLANYLDTHNNPS